MCTVRFSLFSPLGQYDSQLTSPVQTVPEPSTVVLFAAELVALVALVALTRRRPTS